MKHSAQTVLRLANTLQVREGLFKCWHSLKQYVVRMMWWANFTHARVLKLISDPLDFVKYYKCLQMKIMNHITLYSTMTGVMNDLFWKGLKACLCNWN